MSCLPLVCEYWIYSNGIAFLPPFILFKTKKPAANITAGFFIIHLPLIRSQAEQIHHTINQYTHQVYNPVS